jgi:hypothetical protein
MAERYWSTILGGDIATDVTEAGAANAGAFVDVRCTYDATGNSKEQLVKALDAVKMYVLQDNWPPA